MLSTSNVTPSSDGSSAMWVTTSVRCSWSDVGVDCVRVGVLGGAANAVRGEQDSSLEYEVVSVPAAYEAVQERLEQVANQVLLGGSRSGDCRMHRMALAIGSQPWPLPCAAHGPAAGPRSGARARPLSPLRCLGCRRRVGLDLHGALPCPGAGDVDLAM